MIETVGPCAVPMSGRVVASPTREASAARINHRTFIASESATTGRRVLPGAQTKYYSGPNGARRLIFSNECAGNIRPRLLDHSARREDGLMETTPHGVATTRTSAIDALIPAQA